MAKTNFASCADTTEKENRREVQSDDYDWFSGIRWPEKIVVVDGVNDPDDCRLRPDRFEPIPTPEECAQVLMDGVLFSCAALRDVTGRLFGVTQVLARHGFVLAFDDSTQSYAAKPYK